jgi:hypothetical protein
MGAYNPMSYADDKFPPILSDPDANDYALLNIVADESDRDWVPSFYRWNVSLTKPDKVL